jgi:hypothetical protein
MGVKQAVKRLAAPVAGPLQRRLEARIATGVEAGIDRRLAALWPGLAVMRAELDGLNRAIPTLLGSVSSQASAERALRRGLDAVSERLEFVRRELFFELRYAAEPSGRSAIEPEVQVVDQEKLTRMAGHLRVNLGAGHLARPEYLNVDARALPGIDVVADVRHLPFEKGTVAELYSAHMLEHFPLEELRTVLLPYWVSFLEPGGSFVAVVPDTEAMVSEYAAGRIDFEAFREVTYGSQEYEGDFHFNGFSRTSLVDLLVDAGLSEVTLRASGRPNGLCYEMEVVGTKPLTAVP